MTLVSVASPLLLALFEFGVVCAVEFACINAMGEMFEPWVMRDDAVLGLVRMVHAKPVLRCSLMLNVEGPFPLPLPCRKTSRVSSACMSSTGLALVIW